MTVKERLVQVSKTLYDWLINSSSFLVSGLPLKERVGYLLSFPNNDFGLIEKLNSEFDLTVYYTKICVDEAKRYEDMGIKIVSLEKPLSLFTYVIPRLTQSKVIICDNYFALLSGMMINSRTHVIQIWHANGAIKTFGWEDQQTKKRSQADQRRFQKVYDSYDSVVVGSDRMGDVFQESYQLTNHTIVKSGLPRTDIFFDQSKHSQNEKKFVTTFPEAKGKKVVLYAPTYRATTELQLLNAAKLLEQMDEACFFIYKFHPHTVGLTYPNHENMSGLRGLGLEDVLASVDYLITDYSSIPFEYSLVNPLGKTFFYCYDLDIYKQEVGLQADFEEWSKPGLAFDEQMLITKMNNQQGLLNTEMNTQWNTYNDGKATERLLNKIRQIVKN